MFSEYDLRLLQAPTELFENLDIKPKDYMIQMAEDNYIVHRELSDREIDNSFPKNRIFQYEERYWLAGIANFPTEEAAERAINSYWEGVRQINYL
ncbi:hypothetical protein M5X00_24110 [Paenibacillus alvei]|uniref:Uncharacterized protein n=1 Tax=Paenibacillus alvei TaxID=44250 RepID=A0ABT4GR32_PAEAL|nr:hypothetical protein [Paenibacillus alvei]MCY9543604.1 hypothetical protein [Paenibacillus alvei]MCY9737326.1 hypothetical protein [Paenibacillus alvei]MCY9757314.1 hypothetical protein [Paenibacillus alvei]MCY9759155.1 hypothetical protein [Paenibacillus alvei]MCY9770386.1 hypothetical protein [Paenibacillus alvei]